MAEKAYLILANGDVYAGESIGKRGETVGEAVFTTGMGAYMETLTDPSYYGQIVMQTFPMIGNYGQIEPDSESEKPALFGYIVRELCNNGSNFRKERELDDYLKDCGIVGISGVDTRAITRTLRRFGVMSAMITSDLKNKDEKLARIKSYKVKNAVEQTTCRESVKYCDGDKRVALWDFGAKMNIERELKKRGCEVIRVPAFYTAEQILDLKPDGIMLSNGGGNPADNAGIIEQLKKLNEKKLPTFGICLGHQLMAIAAGAKTKKLKYGHRGANQPVKDLQSGKTHITSQNHGYAVAANSLPENAVLRFTNANDRTCEGIDYTDAPAFSVQFHPEACGGPLDTEFLFDRFVAMMEDKKNA